MISKLLSGYVIKKITTTETPKFEGAKCINTLQKRQPCHRCQNICPTKAISVDGQLKIDANKCEDCSMCIGVCPTGAIIPSLETLEKQYTKISNDKDIVISCHKESQETSIKVKCLASIPWELLAYIALDGQVHLVMRHCSQCDKAACKANISHTLKDLKTFLGKESYLKNVRLYIGETKVEVKEKMYTRRELLQVLRDESKRLMTDMVPIDFKDNRNGRIYRSLLIQKIKQTEHANKSFTWPGITIQESCWACGVCTQICPQTALTLVKQEDNHAQMVYDYTKCGQCGMCKSTCLEKAIELSSVTGSVKEQNKEWDVLAPTCTVCGEPIKARDGHMCAICKRKKSR